MRFVHSRRRLLVAAGSLGRDVSLYEDGLPCRRKGWSSSQTGLPQRAL